MKKVKVMNGMAFAVLSPFIFADAVVFGWRAAEDWLDDF